MENFKRAFSLKNKENIPLQALGPSNELVYNENVYKVDEINTPVEIFISDATYMHNGIPSKHPTSTVYREENEKEIVTVVRNSNHELLGLSIHDKIEKETTEINRISSDVFATVEENALDYDEINSKFFYGERADELEDQINNITHKNINRRLSSCTSFKILEFAVAYESSFCAHYGSASNADMKVVSIVADVSSKFEQNGLCVKVLLSHLEGYCDSSSDPYKQYLDTGLSGCGNMGLLDGVREYWGENRENVKRDAMHLFHGTDLECNSGGCIIGCAFTKTLCLNTALGVNHITYTSSRYLQATLVAHELGHVCGASHEAQNNYIMNANINLAPLGFSSGSIASMRQRIDSTRCVKDEIEPTPTPTFLPSSSPTNFPSSQPTLSISSLPSTMPSSLPSIMSSSSPTLSFQPFTFPSSLPTITMSQLDTPHPSSINSYEPSEIYTTAPSTIPSMEPTPKLSYMPSFSPSEAYISFKTVVMTISFQLQDMGIPQTEENAGRMRLVMESSLRNIFNDEEKQINLLSFEHQMVDDSPANSTISNKESDSSIYSELVGVTFRITQNATCINTCSHTITQTLSIISDSIIDGSFIAETKEAADEFLIKHLYKNVGVDVETLTVIDALLSDSIPVATMKTIIVTISFQLYEMGIPQTVENADRMRSVVEPSLRNIFNDEEKQINLLSFEQHLLSNDSTYNKTLDSRMNDNVVDVAVEITQNAICSITCSETIATTQSTITDSIANGSFVTEMKLVSGQFLVEHLYRRVKIDVESLSVTDSLISDYTPTDVDDDPNNSCRGSLQLLIKRILSL